MVNTDTIFRGEGTDSTLETMLNLNFLTLLFFPNTESLCYSYDLLVIHRI